MEEDKDHVWGIADRKFGNLRSPVDHPKDVLDFLVPNVSGGSRLYAAAQSLKIVELHQFEGYFAKDLIAKGARREDIGNLEEALEPLGIKLKGSERDNLRDYQRLEHNNRKTYALRNYRVKLEGKDKVWVNDTCISVPKTGRHTLTQEQLYRMFTQYKKEKDFDKLGAGLGVTRFTVMVYLQKAGILKTKKDLVAEGKLKE